MVIRPATSDDVRVLMPDTFGKSLRAIVVEDGDRLLGIAGVIHTAPLQCFSDFSEELRSKPKVILRSVYALRSILNKYDAEVYVVADEGVASSGRFLERIGFEKVNEEGLYRWPLQSHT